MDEISLFKHIENTRDDKPWVLLIDDLHMLGRSLDSGVSDLLRNILDTKGQYVVYTSLVPFMNIKEDDGTTERKAIFLCNPTCLDVEAMSKMFVGIEPPVKVTSGMIAMTGGMPSLLWTQYRGAGVTQTPAERFKLMMG